MDEMEEERALDALLKEKQEQLNEIEAELAEFSDDEGSTHRRCRTACSQPAETDLRRT